MPAKKPIHKAKKVQARELAAQQAQEVEYPKPPWWREEIHGKSAMEERQELRRRGLLNRRKRPVGPGRGLYYLAHALMQAEEDRRAMLPLDD